MLQVSTAGAEQAIGADFAAVYRGSKLFQENAALIERLSVPPPGSAPLHFAHKHAQAVLTQFGMLFWKCAGPGPSLACFHAPRHAVVSPACRDGQWHAVMLLWHALCTTMHIRRSCCSEVS
jgi:hypothetical protein